MSSTARRLPLNISANTIAADTNCTAVALAEYLAAFVSFQWQQARLLPTQNVNSAVSHLLAACHFSGNDSIQLQLLLHIEDLTRRVL